jgi:hypothetical protein
VNCKEKHRLLEGLEEYDAARQRLSQAVEGYGGVIGTPGVERDQAKHILDAARKETMAALQTHLLLHGCGHAGKRLGIASRDALISSPD